MSREKGGNSTKAAFFILTQIFVAINAEISLASLIKHECFDEIISTSIDRD
jgi:hypothetical protein